MSQSRDSNASATGESQSPELEDPQQRTARRSKRRFKNRTPFARERDVFRQLQPWKDTFKPTTLYRNPWPDVPGEDPPVPAQPCPDTALSAFAQLCALRLHARRCLVSLTSKEREYVLSDMTRTTSLQYDYFEDPLDAPWLGTCGFPRSASINDLAFDDWNQARDVRKVPDDADYYYTEGTSPHYHIVSDLRHDSRYHDIDMVKHGQWARFCLSVPLRGGHGSVIGSIILLDDKLRHGVSAMEMKLMEEMSDTIVQHLETIRVGVQRYRGERMLQAIKTFNGGKGSLRSWWQVADDANVLAMGRHVDPGNAHDRQLREDAQFGSQSPNADHRHDDRGTLPDQITGETDIATDVSKASGTRPTKTQRSETRNSLGRKTHEKFGLEDGFDLATASTKAYHRGANLLREALNLDGVLIVNTTISGSRANLDASERDNENMQDGEISEPDPNDLRLCEIFASSVRKEPDAGKALTEDELFHMSMAALKRLMKRYSDGCVFHIDADGTAHLSSDDSQSATDTNNDDSLRGRPSRDGRTVHRSLQHAKSVAFYPIWDDSIERHRACIFAYSLREEQYRDNNEDIPYLSAFGHSLSATLSHFESVAADTAKGKFISSISHELRSPLHGIMAGVELLQESELATDQHDMCTTISAAGTILLDTINHILDYSKISNHVRAERRGNKVADVNRNHKDAHDAALVSCVDLAQLTEDVAETAVVSHRAQQRPSISVSRDWPGESSRPSVSGPAVAVILDIEHKPHWHVETQPGGWTTIIINLLTNSLKYTKRGHIRLGLQAEDPVEAQDDDASTMRRVTLSVEDTGVGMSDDFVRHGAWLPFKQVDPHSTGTGLGLSIVHEIAKDMGADIKLYSHLDRGTRVEVSFMGRFPIQPTLLQLAPQVQRLQMLSMVPHTDTSPDDVQKDHSADLSPKQSVVASVRKTAESWLQATVVNHNSVSRIEQNSLCAITQLDLEEWQTQKPDEFAALLSHLATIDARLMILAKAVDSSLPSDDSVHSLKPVFLQQPIGPRKLIKAAAGNERPGVFKRMTPAEDKVAERASPPRGKQKRSLVSPAKGKATAKASGGINSAESSSSGEDAAAKEECGLNPRPMGDTEDSGEQMALLVEDNDVNMKLLVALMNKLNLKYLCATNGQEAYEKFRSRPAGYFLILMDISMPVMDGFMATSKIRDFETTRRLPRTRIVALTGVTNHQAKRQAFDAGVDEYYAKPVRMKELKELVDRVQTRQSEQPAS